MSQKILKLVLRHWYLFVMLFICTGIFAVVGFLYLFAITEAQRVTAAELNKPTPTDTPTPTVAATLWPGPPPTVTRTPTLFPTVMATDVLAESGFAPGFTPTPRPTREPVFISLPNLFPANARAVDVPVINQIHYPESFFPPGTNNACGPVALFAALQALHVEIDYSHLRNIAVNNGFTHYGISTTGMVNTVAILNHDLGNPLTIEHNHNYALKDVMHTLRQRGVATVLIRVRKENGRYRVTGDPNNSVGHFLIIDSINLRTGMVQFAGSTLGMDKVSLQEFLQSWAANPYLEIGPQNTWQSKVRAGDFQGWALMLHRAS